MADTHSTEEVDKGLGESINMMPSPVPQSDLLIKGECVTLQGLTKSDLPSLWKNLALQTNHEHFSFLWFLPKGPTANPEALWEMLSDLRTRNFIIYAIKADPARLSPSPQQQPTPVPSQHIETLGLVAYLNVTPSNRAIEIGAVMYGPALQRTAAATEAQYLMLRHAFGDDEVALSPPYRRVAWKCDSLNKASRRAAERLGFRYEGTFRKHMIGKGRSRDTDWLSIIDDEWPTVKAGLEAWLHGSNFDEDGKQIRTLDDLREAAARERSET